MKKKLFLLVVLLVINGVLIWQMVDRSESAQSSAESEEIVEEDIVEEEIPAPTIHTAIPLVEPEQQYEKSSELVYDMETKEILYANNIDTPLGLASVTKTMTLYILMEKMEAGEITLDDTVVLSPHFFQKYQISGLASAGLRSGETYRIEDLLKAITTVSANDAAVALAEALGGTEENFVRMMNERAHRLEMTNATYENATGLTMPNEYNRASARDLATLAEALITNYPQILQYTSLTGHMMPNGYYAKTTNLALEGQPAYLPYIDGLKTGYTIEAGQNFIGTGEIEGTRFLVVLQNAAPGDPNAKVAKFHRTGELVEQYVKPHIEKKNAEK